MAQEKKSKAAREDATFKAAFKAAHREDTIGLMQEALEHYGRQDVVKLSAKLKAIGFSNRLCEQIAEFLGNMRRLNQADLELPGVYEDLCIQGRSDGFLEPLLSDPFSPSSANEDQAEAR